MKSKVIRFRCTADQATLIKMLAGDDVSAWILSKLLTNVATMAQEGPQVKEGETIPPKPSETPLSKLCFHCDKPIERLGWHNGGIVAVCLDHG